MYLSPFVSFPFCLFCRVRFLFAMTFLQTLRPNLARLSSKARTRFRRADQVCAGTFSTSSAVIRIFLRNIYHNIP